MLMSGPKVRKRFSSPKSDNIRMRQKHSCPNIAKKLSGLLQELSCGHGTKYINILLKLC